MEQPPEGAVESLWSGGDEYLYTIVWGHHEEETARRLAWVDAAQQWGISEAEEYDWATSRVIRLYGMLHEESPGADPSWLESTDMLPGYEACTKVEPQ